MVVRVAFAVQAQVNPDILIVDEALAVGDAVFQHKCARRIQELRERGTTLLFVSHDPGAVATFCDQGLLLHQGEQVALGSAKEIVELYLARVKQEVYVNPDTYAAPAPQAASFIDYTPPSLGSSIEGVDVRHVAARIGTGEGRIVHVNIFDADGQAPVPGICSGEAFRLRIRIQADKAISHPVLAYRIDTLRGIHLTGSTSRHDDFIVPALSAGHELEVDIETKLPLKPATYSLALYLNNMPPGLPPVTLDGMETAAHIDIKDGSAVNPIYMLDTDRNWQVLGQTV